MKKRTTGTTNAKKISVPPMPPAEDLNKMSAKELITILGAIMKKGPMAKVPLGDFAVGALVLGALPLIAIGSLPRTTKKKTRKRKP